MERMINERLVWFLETNNILTNIQCGLRKIRNTIYQLVILETFIRDHFVNKEHAVSVFFDLEKTYDATWKYGIMKDLHYIGLKGHLPNIIKPFLGKRNFNMRLGYTISIILIRKWAFLREISYQLHYLVLKLISLAEVLWGDRHGSSNDDDFVICYK